ncbi:ATP-binding cassette domain-containing protein [Candidatus Gracilibacteria bacterium]|nr:ATP-binding cassette domain-containing protein [Candidatus Gracilibacteria bacterium]
MIKLEGITKEYKMGENTFQVLKGVNLEIKKGDFVSIMGPSGSGKSTLMNIIGMLDVATSGNYTFDGTLISGKKEDDLSKIRGKNIGFIFQSYNLISRMPVIKQVMLPLAYQGVPKSQREKIAIESLRKVGLEDKKHNKPNELSGGQQQRVSIARALAVNPGMILADEPTGALDTKTGEEIMNLLTKLNDEGKTIVLITHEKDIDAYAKKHILIKDGLIVN